MASTRDRTVAVWKRTIWLSWPIAIQQTLNTLMRTVDIVVAGMISPFAVAAVGLADLYAQFPLRIGLSLGTGAIALSSQETGRGVTTIRDRAITQALVMGFLLGLPFTLIGLGVSGFLIEILGAEADVVELGGAYLLIVFAAAPMRITGLVGARSLQGTGDTITPMLVNGGANMLNIYLTITLGLGLLGMPDLGIIGIGVATAISRTFEAVFMVLAIVSRWTEPGLARPRSLIITKQLIDISLPNFAEGLSSSLASFPFNAIILLFGTEANAAYHIGRRVYQQLGGPLYRSYSVATSILVGQSLGEGDTDEARFITLAITAFGVLTLGVTSGILLIWTESIAWLFTDDLETLEIAIDFVAVFALAIVLFGIFSPVAGCLRGAGDTRTPFYARLSGAIVFQLGLSYLLAVVFGLGLLGIYLGLILNYAWWVLVVSFGFFRGTWQVKASEMIAERAAMDD